MSRPASLAGCWLWKAGAPDCVGDQDEYWDALRMSWPKALKWGARQMGTATID